MSENGFMRFERNLAKDFTEGIRAKRENPLAEKGKTLK